MAPLVTALLLLVPSQYALYKKMTQAAILIQSKFRSYYEQKKFQQSRRAAVLIQKFYRSYKKCGKRRQARRTAVIVQQKLRWVEISWQPGEPRLGRKSSPLQTRGSVCTGSEASCSDFLPEQSRGCVTVELHLCPLPILVHLAPSVSLHPPPNHSDAPPSFNLYQNLEGPQFLLRKVSP